ncbi:MAG: SDR family NAD(P)-dependent oxidoreductase [Pseudomonadota bacterium]
MAPLNGTQTVLGDTKTRNGGTIINIDSIAGKKSFPDHTADMGTEFVVSTIGEKMREAVADNGARGMAVRPGTVETELPGHTTRQDCHRRPSGP